MSHAAGSMLIYTYLLLYMLVSSVDFGDFLKKKLFSYDFKYLPDGNTW